MDTIEDSIMNSADNTLDTYDESTNRRSGKSGALAKGIRILQNPETRGSLFCLFDQCLVSGTNFLTVIIVGRSCLPEQLGIFHLLMTIIMMSYLFQDALTSAPYRVYRQKKSEEERSSYTGSLFVHQLFVTALVLMVLGGVFLASSVGYLPSGLLHPLIPLIGLVPFILMREFIRRLSFAHLQFGIAVLIDFVVTSIQLSALITLMLLDSLTVFSAYLIIGSGCTVSVALWFFLNPVKRNYNRVSIKNDWLQNWSFARWSMGSLMTSNLPPMLILPWLLALSAGEASTGILAACFSIVGIANVFLNGVENMLGPKSVDALHQGGKPQLKTLLAKSTVFMGVIMTVFCLLLSLYGEDFAMLIYGEKYAIYASQIGWTIMALSFHVLVSSIGMAASNGLWALEKPNSNFYASFLDMVVTLFFSVILVLLIDLGPIGVALATAAGTTAGTILRWIYFGKAFTAAPDYVSVERGVTV